MIPDYAYAMATEYRLQQLNVVGVEFYNWLWRKTWKNNSIKHVNQYIIIVMCKYVLLYPYNYICMYEYMSQASGWISFLVESLVHWMALFNLARFNQLPATYTLTHKVIKHTLSSKWHIIMCIILLLSCLDTHYRCHTLADMIRYDLQKFP